MRIELGVGVGDVDIAVTKSMSLTLLIADNLSPVSSDSYRFSQHLSYLKAYRAGLDKLAALECQILLTPHPSASNMRTRLQSSTGLTDANGCVMYSQAVK
ncbi:metallo-beta-lactamase class B [Rheinheimera pacifica]|uniref:Metallo-beta-lactamase class B n=1 Tax=Rheinheimera pacifica TaxID=173990 RepID=A0A1H6NF31_9GAMM|nr:hypothetical protein [Rheinheimera pacifica]SEI10497.1 metallo-beta-lactamase class B [Rheinheimera pacifica]